MFTSAVVLVAVLAMNAAAQCPYRTVWGRRFSYSYPQNQFGNDCKSITVSCSDVEVGFSTYKTMAIYLETDKQSSPRRVTITPSGGSAQTISSTTRRTVKVLQATTATIDFTNFLFSQTDSDRFDYDPVLSIRCYTDALPNPSSSVSISSTQEQLIARVLPGTSVPIVCSDSYASLKITSISGTLSSGINYYTDGSTGDRLAVLPTIFFSDYVIVANTNRIGTVQVEGYCYKSATSEEIARIVGLSILAFSLIIVGSCCCCCCLIGLCVYLACRQPSQNVYVVPQPGYPGYVNAGAHASYVPHAETPLIGQKV